MAEVNFAWLNNFQSVYYRDIELTTNNWGAIKLSIIKYIFRENKPSSSLQTIKNNTRQREIRINALAALLCSVSVTVLSNNYQAETTRQKRNNLQIEASSLVLR